MRPRRHRGAPSVSGVAGISDDKRGYPAWAQRGHGAARAAPLSTAAPPQRTDGGGDDDSNSGHGGDRCLLLWDVTAAPVRDQETVTAIAAAMVRRAAEMGFAPAATTGHAFGSKAAFDAIGAAGARRLPRRGFAMADLEDFPPYDDGDGVSGWCPRSATWRCGVCGAKHKSLAKLDTHHRRLHVRETAKLQGHRPKRAKRQRAHEAKIAARVLRENKAIAELGWEQSGRRHQAKNWFADAGFAIERVDRVPNAVVDLLRRRHKDVRRATDLDAAPPPRLGAVVAIRSFGRPGALANLAGVSAALSRWHAHEVERRRLPQEKHAPRGTDVFERVHGVLLVSLEL